MKEINFGWRYSSNRKVHQRAVNRVIRKINESIKRDELWRGRVFIRQYESRFFRYEDGSGNQLLCVLRFYDHKTQKYMDMCASSNQIFIHGGWDTRIAMNNFIVYRLNVWKNEDPRADKTDYRTFSEEETIKNSTPLAPY